METPEIKCETIFNTTENTMTQVFSEKIKLIVDFKNLIVALLIGEVVVDKFSFKEDYTLTDFDLYQKQVINIVKRKL